MTNTVNTEAIESQAAVWVARRDAAERWTPDLEAEMQAWIAESPAHHIAWLRLNSAWHRMDRLADETAIRAVSAPGAMNQPVPRRARRRLVAAWGLAASIVLGIGITAVVLLHGHRGEQFETRVGAREAVTLADGSQVTLNTHTRGRAVVNERERRFWLDQGEAYFEIVHDPSRPFVVLAGRDRLTVLGTKFSVRYGGDRTEVTVLEGRVRLDREGSALSAPVILTRSESAVSQAGNVLVIAKNDQEVRDELSWREGRLVFDRKTLAEVAEQFNRYNRTRLVIEGTAAERRFSGSFDANNVEGFARLLHQSFRLDVRTEADRIVVTAD